MAKDDLIKKIDSAKQRIVELKEKYAKTLQMLVTTKQKLSDQQRMEQALARLQEQCHVVLDGHEQRGVSVTVRRPWLTCVLGGWSAYPPAELHRPSANHCF